MHTCVVLTRRRRGEEAVFIIRKGKCRFMENHILGIVNTPISSQTFVSMILRALNQKNTRLRPENPFGFVKGT